MIVMVSKHCSKEFKTYPSHAKRRIYCSNRCKGFAIFNIPKNRQNNIKSIPRRENAPNWKGGFWINKPGYKILEYRENGKRIRIFEHRQVMEKYMGRKLKQNESVHHVDKNKLNNNIDNLQLMTKSSHTYLHYLENPEKMSIMGKKGCESRWSRR